MSKDIGKIISDNIDAMNPDYVRSLLLSNYLHKNKEDKDSPYAKGIMSALQDTPIEILRKQLKRVMFIRVAKRRMINLCTSIAAVVLTIAAVAYISLG